MAAMNLAMLKSGLALVDTASEMEPVDARHYARLAANAAILTAEEQVKTNALLTKLLAEQRKTNALLAEAATEYDRD